MYVFIDRDPPECKVKGYTKNRLGMYINEISFSNTVTGPVKVVGDCSDGVGQSTCKTTNPSKIVSSSGTYSPGTVYDYANNSKVCDSVSVNIK